MDELENFSENRVTDNTELSRATISQTTHNNQFNVKATGRVATFRFSETHHEIVAQVLAGEKQAHYIVTATIQGPPQPITASISRSPETGNNAHFSTC